MHRPGEDRETRGVDVSGRSPFQRFGWMLWGAWMVFLVFPLLDVLGSGHPWSVKVLGLALLAAFAGIFTHGSYLTVARPEQLESVRRAALEVLVLSAPIAASVPIIGIGVISYLPFVISFATFALPRPWVWLFSGGVVAGTAAVLLLPSPRDDLPFGFVLLAVALATGAGRVMRDHGEDYSRRNDEITVIAERERVARDVHDVLGHSLTVLAVKADLAGRLIDVDPERARAEMADVQQLSREALAEIRATVGGLRAARLADEIDAARTALRGAGIDADLPEDARVLDPRHRPVAGWVLREAVTNVIRHSRATRCTVELTETGLVVTDDGVGVRSAPESLSGNGIRGVRERLQGTGGWLEIGPGPDGAGTRLEVSW